MSRNVQVGEGSVLLEARAEPGRPDGFVVTVGEERVPVTARRDADGAFTITLGDGRRFRAAVSRDGSARWVSVGGRTWRVDEARAAAGGAGGSHEGSLEAPMPGKVLDVKVAAGDAVTRGQVLVVVEAMKMEHAVKAPRDGTIARVSVAAGDMVNPGSPLVTLEEAAP
ncbi:MAG: hypothetical protein H6744_07340 [Deltaproteobacteria bacterium]|nr:hypothetical protein [Deltaproteobacteria bacterium]MCB9786493.1 hypothetical protein [Deltaproteobacteria bacterium]